jgi:hypothetical protein
VLRGGAFNNESNNVRAACRNRNDANNRNNNIGFRVVAGASCLSCGAIVQIARCRNCGAL